MSRDVRIVRLEETMPANDYEFVTNWKVAAPAELVFDILKQGGEYARWWPEVYLNCQTVPSGSPDGLGDKVILLTRGKLPYKLRWTATSIRIVPPKLIEIEASGDFVGRGTWTLTPGNDGTDIRFDWILRADKPLIKILSPLLKPVFKWNHRWAMERGYESLLREIKRRTEALSASAAS